MDIGEMLVISHAATNVTALVFRKLDFAYNVQPNICMGFFAMYSVVHLV